MRGAVTLSPGVDDLLSEAVSGDTGTLLIEYVPFGVINSITPTTNPTSTVINHAIIMVAAGNAVVFSPHPNARDCTEETMHIINEAIVKAGRSRESAHVRCERQSTDSKRDYGPRRHCHGRRKPVVHQS